MTSSKPPRQVPPPAGANSGAKAGAAYARFIPREELQQFAAWSPDSWSATGVESPARAPSDAATHAADSKLTREDIAAGLQAARQSGYDDGYRDGLAALESFKRSFAAQTSAQAQTLLATLATQFDTLDQAMADAVTHTALKLARQVVRSELTQRPALVAQVASEAVNALVLSARHVRVRVHPQDHALVAHESKEALQVRGAQLLSDPAIERGGCVVESDLGLIDVQMSTRWSQASAAFGREEAWSADIPQAMS